MRKFVALLAIVGATVVVALSQTSGAFIDGGHEQPCQENNRRPMLMDGLTREVPWSDGVASFGKKSHSEVSNDADQCNGKLEQDAHNSPFAWIDNKNINKNPQFALLGANDSTNDQSNSTWLDQSQNVKGAQVNLLWQGISVNHAPAAWLGGGGPPLSNDADQKNEKLEQDASNWAFSWVDNKNVNFNPQFTLLGSNTSTNTQSNETSIDQSQNVKAAQVNVAGQSIRVGPPIDPSNDADQSNGKLEQEAWNKPHAFVDNKNVNFNPQFTLLGSNTSNNTQSNDTSVDQSQNVAGIQLNGVLQTIGLG